MGLKKHVVQSATFALLTCLVLQCTLIASVVNFSSSGGGPPPTEKMPKYFELVGAAASHMATRVANRHDSDGRHTVPVSTAAVVEILAPMQQDDDSRYCCNFDASPGIMLSILIATCYGCYSIYEIHIEVQRS